MYLVIVLHNCFVCSIMLLFTHVAVLLQLLQSKEQLLCICMIKLFLN